jgi:hypothetical protein
LQTLQACPLPNLLVLNPSYGQQRKQAKQLGAIGLEYQQIHPVFTIDTLLYSLVKYKPHTVLIDDQWWCQQSIFKKWQPALAEQQFEQLLTGLSRALERYEHQHTANQPLQVVFCLTPQQAQQLGVVEALGVVASSAAVEVLWKPYKRAQLANQLDAFLTTTAVQLDRRYDTADPIALV